MKNVLSTRHVISVLWGKSHFYSLTSNEPFVWDGSLDITGGALVELFHLHCSSLFAQPVEIPERIDGNSWKSEITPGSAMGLEGIRFTITGNSSTVITINLKAKCIRFTLEDLLNKEHIRFRVGGKYTGYPIDVYLGPDARPRISRRTYLQSLAKRNSPGWLILPDDFDHCRCHNIFSTYGAVISPGTSGEATFPLENSTATRSGNCIIKMQLLSVMDIHDPYSQGDRWMDLDITINNNTYPIHHLFTSFRTVQKLEDLYLEIPWNQLRESNNRISITNTDSENGIFVHRIYIGEEYSSHRNSLASLPPLPPNPNLWVGFDTNTLTPENGEIDRLLDCLHEEQLGNYILIRTERRHASPETLEGWAEKLIRYNFLTACEGHVGDSCDLVMTEKASSHYLGVHSHEYSNLIYGWGSPDPMDIRQTRTLPDCQAAYLQRMQNRKIVGQAIPQQHLDYAAGVDLVISELPAGHSSLLLASARGAALAYNKSFWGVHIANHVPKAPADEDMERRNYILLTQSWLYGARLIYDEESALIAFHDAPYAYSDPIPYNRRQQYQSLYHYGSAIELGEPVVSIGFLHGNYDCLVGGVQADASSMSEPTKVWGMIGPETPCWKFDTPERGWELLSHFMPGVWLYPVEQEPTSIRQFFSGTPNGQVDLVPINANLEILRQYSLLILPGWNTMTPELYDSLIEYVRAGGHLVLCAAQCTEHTTREFLEQKKDFQFIHKGDFRRLAGVRIGNVDGISNGIYFNDGVSCACPDLPSLEVEIEGAEILARDSNGMPALVEHRIGLGRVWMLTAGEYWGHRSLDDFRPELCRRLAALHRQSPYLSGDTEDIDYHCYAMGDIMRVVLLNTDWTSAGNCKAALLHTPSMDIDLVVREGSLTQVLLGNDAAVVFETPSVIVDQFQQNDSMVSFCVHGSGKSVVHIHSARPIHKILANGLPYQHTNHAIEFDLSSQWSSRNVEIHMTPASTNDFCYPYHSCKHITTTSDILN